MIFYTVNFIELVFGELGGYYYYSPYSYLLAIA